MDPIFFDFEAGLDGHIYLLAVRIDNRTIIYVCDEMLTGISAAHDLKAADPAVPVPLKGELLRNAPS